MSDPLTILGGLISALGNVQSTGVLKEHVALLRTQIDLINESFVKLEAENARLIRHNTELMQQVERHETLTQFVEKRGALFKKVAGEGYADTPYCPVCRSAMWTNEGFLTFECGNQSCRQMASFTGNELKDVMSHLPP